MNHSPIIIALDVASGAEARRLETALGDTSGFYKVGLELYAAAGMDFVRELKAQGKNVFLDLKLYDISEQVKRAVAVMAESGADFLTVHAVSPDGSRGGQLRRIVEAAGGDGADQLRRTGCSRRRKRVHAAGAGGKTGRARDLGGDERHCLLVT